MSRTRGVNYKKPKNTKQTLVRLIKYLGYHRWTMVMIAILVVVSSMANIFGTYLLKPIVNETIISFNINALIKMLFLLGIIYGIGVLATLAYNQLMVHVAQSVIAKIRSELFEHVQTLELSYFDQNTVGEIMGYFTSDIDTVSDALNNSFTLLIQSFTVTLGTLIMIVVLDWRLSSVVFVCLGIMVVYVVFNSKKSRLNFREQQKSMGALNSYIEEIVSGQRVSRVFNHEEEDLVKFRKLSQALRSSGTKAQTYSGRLVPVIVSISYINYALSAMIGGLFAISNLMSVGTLTAYLVFVRQSAMPLNQFSNNINFILVALAGAERIFEVMDVASEQDEGLYHLVFEDNKYYWMRAGDKRELQGRVSFDKVRFGYSAKHDTLRDISLYANPGQKIAFVGSTGAGKTTIINLISRFYEIKQGTIYMDGIDIREIAKNDLRQTLGMVIQETHLFTGTIADNIRYGRLDASEDEVIAAAKLANADSFIRRLPQGYQTMLENDGGNLSQGQRQLLSIARTAVANPPVLILDEATSSIDTRTEKLIEKGMDRLMEGRTVFVIAHRLSTVRNSTAIMVLEKGEIVERGNHQELLDQKGIYYQLYTGKSELT